MVIGVIGLGLIGGSMALALKKNLSVSKIMGYDLNLIHCEEALDLKIVDEIVAFEELLDVDILFLAIPVEGIIEVLKKLQNINKNCTIIDLGSTKEKIIDEIPSQIRENFIPAHPMAGKEKIGPKSAVDDLYENMVVVFCDIENSKKIHHERAKMIFQKLKMRIVYMDAVAHDKHAAFISHLPSFTSYALANTVMNQEDPKNILTLAAGGFKDMSRIAKSSPAMWGDIFKQNKTNVLNTIELFQKELTKASTMIKEEKWQELEIWMKDATTLHKIL